MEIYSKKLHTFTPIEFNIKIENLDELKCLWNLFNRTTSSVEKDANKANKPFDYSIISNMVDLLFDEVDEELEILSEPDKQYIL